MEAVLPGELSPFLRYLRAFKKVRDGSFNSHTYDRNTPVYIQEVVETAKELKQFGLNFIPKHHMMLHVPEFCEMVNAPLGKFGDQGIEQVLLLNKFLAPSRSPRSHNVCLSVRHNMLNASLEQSIFIILAQIFKQSVRNKSAVSEHSVSTQRALREHSESNQ